MKIFLLLFIVVTALFSVVDINNATLQELSSLKGIGKKKASKIIKYREQHCFQKLKELKKVKGISKKGAKKIIKKNKGNITVGECEKVEVK